MMSCDSAQAMGSNCAFCSVSPNALSTCVNWDNLITDYNIAHAKEKKVLDIGCSYGEFLVLMGQNSVGLTSTQEEVKYGEGHLEKRGFKIQINEGIYQCEVTVWLNAELIETNGNDAIEKAA